MVEALLVDFQYGTLLLRAWHGLYCKAQGLGDRFEASVAKAAAPPELLAGVKPGFARIVEFGHAIIFRLPERSVARARERGWQAEECLY